MLRVVRTVALLLAVAAAGPALAAPQLYWTTGPAPTGLDQVNVREFPGGHLLIAAEDRAPLSGLGLTAIHVPPGSEAFVVELRDQAADLQALTLETRVLQVLDGFALVAADPRQARSLGVLAPHCKERLAYVAPALPRVATAQLGKEASVVDPAVKTALVTAVNQAKYAQYIRELSGDIVFWLDGILRSVNNRNTYKSTHVVAADYIQDRFETWGYSVIRQPFTVNTYATTNVIGVKTGTVYPDEIIVVGGHYDSISENINLRAPGAEDNATGTAAVMHLAELFASYQTERTIHFVCFSGEEQGLYGSEYYVNQLGTNGWNVTNSLIMDMVSAWRSNYKVIIEGQTSWEPLMSLFEGNVVAHAGIGYRKDYFSFGSDHVPFQGAGIPCFLAIDLDYEEYPYYHRTDDQWNKPCPEGHACLDPSLGAKITKAMAATLADLAVPLSPLTATPPTAPAARLVLGQNAPNPFNPATTIPFELFAAGHAQLSIYDAAGRLVRVLVDADLPAGKGSRVWDGNDGEGRAVASGLYHYRLRTTDGELTRRMVLTR